MSFPVTEIGIKLPDWVEALPENHEIKSTLFNTCFGATENVNTLSNLEPALRSLEQCDYIKSATTDNIDLGTGKATINIDVPKELYYKVVKEISG